MTNPPSPVSPPPAALPKGAMKRSLRWGAEVSRYGAAVGGALMAVALTHWSEPLFNGVYFAPSLGLVAVLALLTGEGPGLLASLLIGLGLSYFTMDPQNSFKLLRASDAWRLNTFLVVSVMLVFFGGALRRNRAKVLKESERARLAAQEAQRAEAESSKARERLEVLLRSISEAFMLLGEDWRFMYVNAATEKLLDRRWEQLQGKTLWEEFPDLVGSEVEKQYQKAITERVSVHYEFFYPRWNRWFDIKAYPAEKNLSIFFQDITRRKQNEEQLHVANAQMKRLIESNVVGIIIASTEGEILDANDYYLNILGYSREEFEAGEVSWMACTPSEYLPLDFRAIEELRARGVCTPYQKEYIRKDGARVWVMISDALLPGPGERIAGFVLDISELRQVEQELREKEQRWRTALSSAPFPMIIHDEDGQVLYINEAWTRFTGYTLEEIPTVEVWTEKAYGQRKGQMRQVIHDFYQLPGPLRTESVRIRTKSGQERIWDAGSAPLGVFSGKRAVISIATDVTDRMQAEQKLRGSEMSLQLAVDATGLGVWDWDLLADKHQWSARAKQIMGFDPQSDPALEEVTARIHPEDRDRIGQMVAQSVKVPQDHQATFRVIWPDQSVHWVRMRGKVLIGAEGVPYRLLSTALDITDQIQAEEERLALEARVRIADKEESLAVLAGGVAHDFNNLLVSVIGYADLLLSDLPPDSPLTSMVEHIYRAGNRAADLARQMLAYSGRGQMASELVQLDKLIGETLELVKSSIPRSVEVVRQLGARGVQVEADPTQLRQVVMNLVINAGEAIGEESAGSITVRTSLCDWTEALKAKADPHTVALAPQLVRLEVADTGSGMSAETQARIFDPFFTTKFTGRGLGLASVKGIVRGHRGLMLVQSEVGKGTVMQVYLPCQPAVSLVPEARAPISSEHSRLRAKHQGLILVVDDEPMVRQLLSDMLQALGFEVLTASNGREGVQRVREQGPELALVILDLTMPVMGGEEAFREIRKIRPELPVLFASGFSDQKVAAHLKELGAWGFIAKPFDPTTLSSLLGQMLRTSSSRSASAALFKA